MRGLEFHRSGAGLGRSWKSPVGVMDVMDGRSGMGYAVCPEVPAKAGLV